MAAPEAKTIAVKTYNAALAAALDGFDFTVGLDVCRRIGREENIALARLAGAGIAREIGAICTIEENPGDPVVEFAELHALGQRLCAIADAICGDPARDFEEVA